MEMKFEFVDSRVFLGRVFPVNFPISRLGDRRRSIILFCSVFSLLFFYISNVAAIIETIETSVVKYFHE